MLKKQLPTVWSMVLYASLICLFITSCDEKKNPETLLQDTMNEVSAKDSGYEDFKVLNSPEGFAIMYEIEDTPENKAKLLWLYGHEELESKMREEILKRLQKGDILARVVKENKPLVVAVYTDNIGWSTTFAPQEIAKSVFKK